MNFRTGPSADSAVVSDCPKLYSGMILTVHEEQGEWYYVEDMYGYKGWARAVYEGEVYLQNLPDNYLETHISAQTALDRAKPIALDWAEDAYLTQMYTTETGWNGLAEVWQVRFFAPGKKEPLPSEDKMTYPEYFRYLEITVFQLIISSSEETGGFGVGGAYIFEATDKPMATDFLDSPEIFTADKLAEYHMMLPALQEEYAEHLWGTSVEEWFLSYSSTMLDLYDANWVIVGPGEYGKPSLILDSQTGELLEDIR